MGVRIYSYRKSQYQSDLNSALLLINMITYDKEFMLHNFHGNMCILTPADYRKLNSSQIYHCIENFKLLIYRIIFWWKKVDILIFLCAKDNAQERLFSVPRLSRYGSYVFKDPLNFISKCQVPGERTVTCHFHVKFGPQIGFESTTSHIIPIALPQWYEGYILNLRYF